MKFALSVVLSIIAGIKCAGVAVKSPSTVHPCPSSKQLTASYVTKRTPDDKNQYDVTLRIIKPVDSEVQIQFDSEASINLDPPLNKAASVTETDNKFNVKFFKKADSVRFRVSGPHKHYIPYITSFIVNGTEYCNNPSIGYFDNFLIGNRNTVTNVRESCGRTKIDQIELTSEGVDPNSGHSPWHVIVNRLERKVYENVCGGTLVSNSWVLTAAHCTIIGETFLQPYYFLITLGYYSSFGHSVSDVIVHHDFNITPLKNDIALLKLKSEVILEYYIQPACVWHDRISEKLSSGDVFGNVLGWVFEEKDDPSAKLRHATILMVPKATCIKSNPMFYTNIVDDRKFCAGLKNDTATWYGDSGGGFHVFVPDNKSNEHHEGSNGAWYVRGILSQSPTTDDDSFDPQQYAVFTDVAKYEQWIQKYI